MTDQEILARARDQGYQIELRYLLVDPRRDKVLFEGQSMTEIEKFLDDPDEQEILRRRGELGYSNG
jgi:hypothetical protein